ALGLAWNEIESVGIWFSTEAQAAPRSLDNAKNAVAEPFAESVDQKSVPEKPCPDDVRLPKSSTDDYASEEERITTEASLKHSIKGWGYWSKKKYWKAIKEANKAIKINPQNYDAYDCLDRSYAKLGIYRKKRYLMIQGQVCDIRSEDSLILSKKERR